MYVAVHNVLTRNDPVELSLLASHLYDIGQVLHSDGMFIQAARAYQDLLRVARRISPPSPPQQDQTSSANSRGEFSFQSSSPIRSYSRHAVEASATSPSATAITTWWSDEIQYLVKCRLAAALRSAGELRRSVDVYREVLLIARMRSSINREADVSNSGYRLSAGEHLSLCLASREDEARCLVQIGLIQRDMGRTTDAIFTLSEALRVAVSIRGTEYNEDVARIMLLLAQIHHVDRRSLDVALFLYRKVLRICRSERVLPMEGYGDPFMGEVLEQMVAVLVEMGDLEAAEHVFEELETCRWAATHWHEGGGSARGGGRGTGTWCAPAA